MPLTPIQRILLLLTAGWSLIVIILLFISITRLNAQRRTANYRPISALVDSVQETSTSSNADPTNPSSTAFSLDVHYHFFLDDNRVDATRLRYGATGFSHAFIASLLQRYHTGAQVPAYYNPSNPAQCVLLRGIEPADYTPLILQIPFTLSMLLLWFLLFHLLAPRSNMEARFAPIDIIDEADGITRIRPAKLLAYLLGISTLVLTSLIALLVLRMTVGANPSPKVAATVVAIAILPAIAITLAALRHLAAGLRDQILDEPEQRLTDIRGKRHIPYSAIISVHIRQSAKPVFARRPALFVDIRYKDADATPPQQRLTVPALFFDAEATDRLALLLARTLKRPAYSAANSRLRDPVVPPEPAPRTEPAVRPVFSNPYKPFQPTRRPPK